MKNLKLLFRYHNISYHRNWILGEEGRRLQGFPRAIDGTIFLLGLMVRGEM